MTVGPILGGFISQYLGWRWAYWIVMMVTVPVNVLMFWYLRESNHPTILERKTRRLRKELGRDDLHSQLEMKLPPREVMVRSLVRPMKVCNQQCLRYNVTKVRISFSSSRPLFSLSHSTSALYTVYCVRMTCNHISFTADGAIDLMLATIPSVFQDIYHFEVQYTGLAYLGCKFLP